MVKLKYWLPLVIVLIVVAAVHYGLKWQDDRKPEKNSEEILQTDDAKLPELIVYKTPTCTCCMPWAEHMREAGFKVKINQVEDLDWLNNLRKDYGIDTRFQSCHTAIIDNYIFEGPIPAPSIKRFLEEKPNALGLAVPGMVPGSPGMEHGQMHHSFDVLIFKKDGRSRIYERYDGRKAVN